MKNEMLVTKASFLDLFSLLTIVKKDEVSGILEIEWDCQNLRLNEWVKQNLLPSKMLQQNQLQLYLNNGSIVGALFADLEQADLDQSIDIALQVGFGIGCSVMPDLTYKIFEADIDKGSMVGNISLIDLQRRVIDLRDKMLNSSEEFFSADVPGAKEQKEVFA